MVINFTGVSGTLRVPSSKSHTQRVLAAAMLHRGTTDIIRPGNSEDELAICGIVRDHCDLFEEIANGWRVHASGNHSFTKDFFCGESGLAARLLTPVAALSQKQVSVTGTGSLLTRPMHFFNEVLPQLGVHVEGNGCLPVRIKGPLCPADITVDGSMSSQFISGLMFAFAFAAGNTVAITIKNPVSIPYLNLSRQVLQLFGKYIGHPETGSYLFDPRKNEIKPQLRVEIEADWSSAAFWICAAAINGSMQLEGLSADSLQADIAILKVLQQSGTPFHFEQHNLFVRSGERRPFTIDLTDAPDLFPVLSVFAAGCNGVSYLSGVHRLKHKESDRALEILKLLSDMHIDCAVEKDTLRIAGGKTMAPLQFVPPADHRMVMATALAAMYHSGDVRLHHNADAVAKSYPLFWEHLLRHGN